MSATTSTPIDAAAKNAPTPGRLFFLDLSAGRILSANPDGSDLKTIINEGRKLPDGLALDVAAGHIYWTNMGDPNRNDGSIMRSDLNGTNMITIVPPGGTFTPKQLQMEKRSGKLYWSDREGMRVMRSNLQPEYGPERKVNPVSRRLAEEMASESGNAIWANQFDNLANREGHRLTRSFHEGEAGCSRSNR